LHRRTLVVDATVLPLPGGALGHTARTQIKSTLKATSCHVLKDDRLSLRPSARSEDGLGAADHVIYTQRPI